MTKIFLDTNIWLRYFLRDNDQFASVEKLITDVEGGRFLPYTSSIVLLEIAFVLGKTYKLSKKKVVQYLQAIVETRNLTMMEKTNSKKAINCLEKYGVKFSDCLIASQLVKDMILVTFDREFMKMKDVNVKTPREL